MNSPCGFIDRMKDPSKINELLSMLKHFSVLTQSTQLGFQPPKSPHLKRTAPNIIFRLLLFFYHAVGIYQRRPISSVPLTKFHLRSVNNFTCQLTFLPPLGAVLQTERLVDRVRRSQGVLSPVVPQVFHLPAGLRTDERTG
jgi:hypothetical protein